jgi:hypothetical protein
MEEKFMKVKAGTRLKSAACKTQVIVVRAPTDDVDLRCGGHAMLEMAADAPLAELTDPHKTGTLLGKRYADDDAGIEVLCTTPGEGSLGLGDTPLPEKGAKLLPSSD